ncbi:MAG: hypothetical protein ACAH27_05675 [Xanthobacteraceae bacterium]
MAIIAPPDSVARDEDWIESIVFEDPDGQEQDYTDTEVIITLRNKDDSSIFIVARLSTGEIEVDTLVGSRIEFTSTIEKEAFAAACPRGDYDMLLQLSQDGNQQDILTAQRKVRNGIGE